MHSHDDAAHLSLPVSARDHAQGPEDAPVTLVETATTNVRIADAPIRLSSRFRSGWVRISDSSSGTFHYGRCIHMRSMPPRPRKLPASKADSGRCTITSSSTSAR